MGWRVVLDLVPHAAYVSSEQYFGNMLLSSDSASSSLKTWFVMGENPESEILAKLFADIGEKCGDKMANFFADFRPSISRKSGRKKLHEKLATNSAGREIKFFHRETLGVWGHKVWEIGCRGMHRRKR